MASRLRAISADVASSCSNCIVRLLTLHFDQSSRNPSSCAEKLWKRWESAAKAARMSRGASSDQCSRRAFSTLSTLPLWRMV